MYPASDPECCTGKAQKKIGKFANSPIHPSWVLWIGLLIDLTDSKERTTMSEPFCKQHTKRCAKSMDKATLAQASGAGAMQMVLYVRQ